MKITENQDDSQPSTWLIYAKINNTTT